jgi:ribosomal protein S18 acetylase RimI-like enzyme
MTSMSSEILPLSSTPTVIAGLARLLVETVEHGGSVSFMHPLALSDAEAFWAEALTAADAGKRIVLGAIDGGRVVATVTLVLDLPPNQPHRAEIAKMMTAVSHRGRGLARALLAAAERLALDHGRSLLVLDTASEEGAAGLYEKAGYRQAGEIPDYAYKPHGGLTGTLVYWKRIAKVSSDP